MDSSWHPLDTANVLSWQHVVLAALGVIQTIALAYIAAWMRGRNGKQNGDGK